MDKRVLIVNPLGFYDAIPSIVSVISYFEDKNDKIDMVTIKSTNSTNQYFNEYSLFSHNVNSVSYNLGKLIFPLFVNFIAYKKKYDAIIAVDNWGLLFSFTLLKKDKKILYLVLHIFSLTETLNKRRYIYYFLKRIEGYLIHKISAILIQDLHRKELFETENNIKKTIKFFILPNSHRGIPNRTKGNYYQALFNLQPTTRTILMAGSIEKWSFPEFLIECTLNQNPKIYKSIIQSRTSFDRNNSYIHNLKESSNEEVLFGLNPVPIDELDNAVSSADIGCAFYQSSTEINHSVLGAASGKMLTYLKNGLPIIMFSSPGVTELINHYNCGKVLLNMDTNEFNKSVKEIFDNYEQYSQNAFKCYEENFDFDSAFLSIYSFISNKDHFN
jgi:glycosyltransferase involved in cell wall biosynthesis